MWTGKLGDATTVKNTDSIAWNSGMKKKKTQLTIHSLKHNTYTLNKLIIFPNILLVSGTILFLNENKFPCSLHKR